MSRCVRRAFLCGDDRLTGKSYEHRRGWIEDRILALSTLFSISLCAYAIMSNHYHLVVRLDPQESDGWSDDKVLEHWTALFRGPLLVQRYQDGESLSEAESDTVRDMAAVYRKRLGSLSWFMKCLNEPIARQANAEDGCTGHFWEARFQSQPLCSDAALVTAMAYVDLNPVRAGTARTPEESAFTSIKTRIDDMRNSPPSPNARRRGSSSDALPETDLIDRPLMPFADEITDPPRPIQCLPINRQAYFELVDQTGRLVVRGKRGAIDKSLLPILSRLGLSANDWVRCSTAFRANYRNGDLRGRRTA